MIKVKYIKTKNNQIIVFSELQNHSDFKNYDPISAGFISIGINNNNVTCNCFGKSISLGLNSNPEVDTKLAKRQILGLGYW
jgi:hypothetical protein